MASNVKTCALGCVKIPVLAKKENAVAALVIGLLQLCSPSFNASLQEEHLGSS